MSDPRQLTADQQNVLRVVLQSFQSNRQWPTYRWLNQIVFVQFGPDFDPVYESMPSGLILPDPQRRVIAVLPPENPIKLTLRALVALGEEEAINVFLGTLREIGTRAANFLPPPDGQGELRVDSSEVCVGPWSGGWRPVARSCARVDPQQCVGDMGWLVGGGGWRLVNLARAGEGSAVPKCQFD